MPLMRSRSLVFSLLMSQWLITSQHGDRIGIYAKGTLEAVYTGGNLSVGQITQMTSGDGSAAAMNNQMWSYRGDNTVPACRAARTELITATQPWLH